MPMPKIALATCLNLYEPDNDQEMMLARFNEAGFDTCLAAWDDNQVEWSGFDGVVVRSTWNYFEHLPEFRAWVSAVDGVTVLMNPADEMFDNTDKRYLLELPRHRIPIVPTVIGQADHGFASKRVVVKPSVGAGSYLTRFFEAGDSARIAAHIEEIEQSGCEALVQPYLESVESGGERSLIWVDGEITHAIVKRPRFDGEDESVSDAQMPSNADLAAAEPVMDLLTSKTLYARIDFIVQDGKHLLSELELVEPSLFLSQHPPALDRLIDGVRKRI